MKTVIYFAVIALTVSAGLVSADSKTPDAASYQNSIMAFGVDLKSAEEAAKAAVESIEERKAGPDTSQPENLFAIMSDEIINNPYGF